MSSTPLFSELISVEFDVSSFTSSLQQLKDAYQSFMSDLSASGLSGNDVLGTGLVADFSESIRQVRSEVSDLAASFKDAFASVGASSSSAAERLSTAASSATDSAPGEVAKRQKKSLEDLSLQLQKGESSWEEFASAGRVALEKGLNPAISTSIALQEQLRSLMKEMSNEGMVFNNKQADFLSKGRNKTHLDDSIIQNGDSEGYLTDIKASSEDAQKSIAELNKQRDAFYRSPYASNASETEERDAQRQRELDSLKADIISRSKPPEEEEQIVNPSALAQFKEGISGIKGNLGGMVANLVAFQLEWGLATIAMQGALAPIVAIRDTIKAGLGYLTDLQTKAADLQGVIASSVKFSDDPFQNFVQSGQAAENIVKKIQDEAVATGMSFSTLSRSFKAFETGGGQHLVNNLSEAVQVSNMFAMAMVAAGKDVQTTRMLMSDVPKLLDGSVTASSSLLRVLGLTQEQWLAIRASASKHHDLLAQLSPLMQNYVSVAEAAGGRTKNLEDALRLAYERAASLVAGPMWESYLGFLKEAVGFFHSQSNEVNATASGVGNLISAVGRLVVALATFGQGAPSIEKGFHGILDVVSSVTEAIIGMTNATTLMVKDLGAVVKLTKGIGPGFTVDQMKGSWKEYVSSVQGNLSEYKGQQKESANRLSDSYYGTKLSAANQPSSGQSLVNQPVEPKGTIPNHKKHHYDNSSLQELESAFKAAADKIKQTTNDQVQYVKDQMANNNVDKLTGLQQIKSGYLADKGHLEEIIEQYVSKASLAPGANPKNVRLYQESLLRYSGVRSDQTHADEAQTQIDALTTKRKSVSTTDAAKAIIDAVDKEIADQLSSRKETGLNKSTIYTRQLSQTYDKHRVAQQELAEKKNEAGSNKDALEQVAHEAAMEENAFNATVKKLTHDIAAAKFTESLTPITNKIRGDQTKVKLDREKAQDISSAFGQSSPKTAQANIDYAMSQMVLAKDQQIKAKAETDHYSSNPQSDSYIEAASRLKDAGDNLNEAASHLSKVKADSSTSEKIRKVLGMPSSKDENGQDLTGSDKLASNVASMNMAVKDVTGAVSAVKQGISQGGVLGGIGAGVSSVSGIVGAVNPLAGAIVGFAGTILSTIGDMFTAEARHIAEEIQRQYTLTMQAYQDNTQTASLTLQQVEQEKQNAISQLSGVKGGQDQLSKLLPQLDSTIAQLKQGIASTLDTFNLAMATMSSNNASSGLTGPIGAMEQQWASVNKQVQQYIAAGGQASTAYQYLSDSLTGLKQQAGNALLTGEQTAIQDALQLNDLLQQRILIEKQQSMSNFSLLTQDSVERRGSNAVNIGVQLQLQKQQQALQMQTMNSQITGLQQQVYQYQQIYQISSNTADLLSTQNRLQSEALAQQISQLQQYAEIYTNIFTNANGGSSMTSLLANFLNQMTFNFNTGQINSDNWLGTIANVAQKAGASVTNTINQQALYGIPPVFQMQF